MTALPQTLLVVEDETAHMDLIRLGFRHSPEWSLRFVQTLEAAQAQLEGEGITMVLADLNLPDGDATSLCGGATPVVIMTSHGDEHKAVSALQSGALDYVVKTAASLRDMPTVIRRAYRRHTLVEQRQAAEHRLQQKTAELESNNRRLSAVLDSARQLASIEDPAEAIRFMAHVVRRELGATLQVHEPPEPTPTFVQAPDRLQMRVVHGGRTTAVCLQRDVPFNDGEQALVRTATGLLRETVRALEAHKELRESQRRLHQADKLQSVGQLAGGIAHDFNNMLAAIMGCAELLRMELEGSRPDLLDDVGLIIDVGQHAAHVTRRLLTFARGGPSVRRPLEVRDALRQLQQMVAHTLPERIDIRMTVQGDPWVRCDPSLLQNALLNLCLNSRDAMPNGGKLLVDVREMSLDEDASLGLPPGDYVEFLVKDTGVGMDAETQRRVFEPFFTTKQPGSGTGLGLAVVFGTFAEEGGAIQVASKLGEGTIFRAYLPILAEQAEGNSGAWATLPGDAGRRVLVVDDDHAVLSTTERLLRRMGHQVTATSEPLEVVELLASNTYDLFVIDMVMPTMGGIELAHAIRAEVPEARMLLMSGYAEDQAQLQDLQEQSIAGFLAKPFRSADLRDALQTLMHASP
jgi:signal transduction histidine kinase